MTFIAPRRGVMVTIHVESVGNNFYHINRFQCDAFSFIGSSELHGTYGRGAIIVYDDSVKFEYAGT